MFYRNYTNKELHSIWRINEWGKILFISTQFTKVLVTNIASN